MTQHSKVSSLVLGMIVLSAFSSTLSCKDSASTTIETFPETCAEVQEQAIEETGDRPSNGTYTLYIDGDEEKPWDAYCHNMNRSQPSEYLTIVEEDNFSQIRNESYLAESTYRRVRIDPLTLEINLLDDTFATTNVDDGFEPVFPADDTLEFVPLGWAEFQPVAYNSESGAEAHVSLVDTPFAFSEIIIENNLSDYFCQVDSTEIMDYETDGTLVEVSVDLKEFSLVAVNINSEQLSNLSTRMVADCENMGADSSTFEEAYLPVDYIGDED